MRPVGQDVSTATLWLTIGLVVVGVTQAGFLGALTGLVTSLVVGGGIFVALGHGILGVGTPNDQRGNAERVTALGAACFTLLLIVYGGWRLGWAWGIAGHAFGILIGLFVTQRRHRWGTDAPATKDSAGDAKDVALAAEKKLTLHDAYFDFLADKPPSLFPESLLPAPMEEVKSAILFVALLRQARGELTPQLLEMTSMGYYALARCVTPDRAAAAATFDAVGRAFQQSAKGTEDVMTYAAALKTASAMNATMPTEEETSEIYRDFSKRWIRTQSEPRP